MPKGGFRVGAGRKKKSALERAIGGGQARGTLLQHPSATAVAPVESFDPPKGLRREVRVVWDELAPHAFAARTLTPATLAAFVMLCRSVMLERKLSESPLGAAGADHRGMMQRVASGLKDFGISPFGKPIYKAAEPNLATLSPLDRLIQRKRS